ncbi:MAG: chemotaxis protein CheW [Candidatus Omnitrophota bacterium]
MAFDRSKFIERFKAETREHVQKLNLGLLRLEKDSGDITLTNEMMREAHTIKGAATMMGYNRIVELTHSMEDALEKVINQNVKLSKQRFDLLFKSLDCIEPLLEDKVTWEDKGIQRPYVDDLCKELAQVFCEGKIDKQEIELAKVEQEDKKIEKKEISFSEKELIKKTEITTVTEENMRVDVKEIDKLMDLSGELLIYKIRLNELVKHLIDNTESQVTSNEMLNTIHGLKRVGENIHGLTSSLQNEVMQVRMVPVSQVFNTFPRAMRDLAHAKGKDINFEIHGEDTQLDKTIIDAIRAPIMHLLRNAIDHGIEHPEERKTQHKPPVGKIELSAYQHRSQVSIEVCDDGRGIDIDKVRKMAIQKQIVTKEKMKEMPDDQVFQLLFTPGFSTKEHVSDVSGRGMGLDVVRDTVAALKGMIEGFSQPGVYTRFTMKLPLTLVVTESLLVMSGCDMFAVPIDTVVETIRIMANDIQTVETKEVITVRGQILPLVRLNYMFGLAKKGVFEKRFFPVVIVQSAEKRVGILVDQLLGHQKIIGKSLGDPLKKIKNIAGATILGDGKVVLILDVASIIEFAEGMEVKPPAALARPVLKEKKRKTILLAEDVLTTAMLEKNILESAGFSVVIVRDGQEAIDQALQEKFDLVITDILMPRVDGFELTARLKKDNLYKDIPIIIVTTRDSDEDKRRGLETGADAYILKSEFTSEGLLEIIERLVG